MPKERDVKIKAEGQFWIGQLMQNSVGDWLVWVPLYVDAVWAGYAAAAVPSHVDAVKIAKDGFPYYLETIRRLHPDATITQ